jgi:FkbM family methyltransferase
MNFSGMGEGSCAGTLLRFPLRLIPRRMRMPILQGRLKGKRWIVGSSNHGCWLGSYEFTKRRLFEKIVSENSVVFDIGAHAGFYTLLSSVLVGQQGKVFAFEPCPANLKFLHEHLRINKVKNVKVIEAAVADWSGNGQFEENLDSSMSRVSKSGSLTIRLVSLDELYHTGEIPPPDVIKIDVEGGEVQILEGAKDLLSIASPTIFLATHGEKIHDQSCDFLFSRGYTLEPIGGDRLVEASEVFAYKIGSQD